MKANQELSCLRHLRWKTFPRSFIYCKHSAGRDQNSPLSIVRYRGEINTHRGMNCLPGTSKVWALPVVVLLSYFSQVHSVPFGLWSFPQLLHTGGLRASCTQQEAENNMSRENHPLPQAQSFFTVSTHGCRCFKFSKLGSMPALTFEILLISPALPKTMDLTLPCSLRPSDFVS